ncbi:hypothetical protein NPX13_g2287 [Xylaria arbuscula]|uniref:Uncharacterized protein n=1 Tax=Xylaria arbuscula TaxID=114810 RepID=A0A9W8NJH5_9PEZI|nr:hypothetical protein NPX13_g2287 [Xylaria arbuscula]
MSEPKSWASTTRSAATPPIPSSSITGTVSHSKPLPPVGRRAATESDEYMSPAAVFSAFVGNEGGGWGDVNKVKTQDYEWHDSRNGHPVLVHEGGRNTSAAVSARPIPVSIHNVNKNNYNNYNNSGNYNSAHYGQRGRRQPAVTRSTDNRGIGGNSFYDLAQDGVDDDVDRSDNDDNGEDWGLGITSYTDNHRIVESRGPRRSVFEGRGHNRQQFEVTQPRTLQSWMNRDVGHDDDSRNNGYVSSARPARPAACW